MSRIVQVGAMKTLSLVTVVVSIGLVRAMVLCSSPVTTAVAFG